MRQWYNNKKIYIAVLIVLASAGLSYMLWAFNNSKKVVEEPLLVRFMTVLINDGGQSFKYSGEVHGRYETQLAFRVK